MDAAGAGSGAWLATAREVARRDLWLGAAAAAVAWQVLQILGGCIVGHQLARSSSLHGAFAVVLGLLAWLYLQAQLTLYAVEANVVRTRGLWPRSLAPPLTLQDRRAYQLYAQVQQRRPEQEVESRMPDRTGEP